MPFDPEESVPCVWAPDESCGVVNQSGQERRRDGTIDARKRTGHAGELAMTDVSPLAIGMSAALLSFVAARIAAARDHGRPIRIDSVYTDIAGAACATVAADAGNRRDDPALPGHRRLCAPGRRRRCPHVHRRGGARRRAASAGTLAGRHDRILHARREGRMAGQAAERQARSHRAHRARQCRRVSDPNVTTSYLAVAKITPQAACVIDRIAPGADMNGRRGLPPTRPREKPCIKQTGL